MSSKSTTIWNAANFVTVSTKTVGFVFLLGSHRIEQPLLLPFLFLMKKSLNFSFPPFCDRHFYHFFVLFKEKQTDSITFTNLLFLVYKQYVSPSLREGRVFHSCFSFISFHVGQFGQLIESLC